MDLHETEAFDGRRLVGLRDTLIAARRSGPGGDRRRDGGISWYKTASFLTFVSYILFNSVQLIGLLISLVVARQAC